MIAALYIQLEIKWVQEADTKCHPVWIGDNPEDRVPLKDK